MALEVRDIPSRNSSSSRVVDSLVGRAGSLAVVDSSSGIAMVKRNGQRVFRHRSMYMYNTIVMIACNNCQLGPERLLTQLHYLISVDYYTRLQYKIRPKNQRTPKTQIYRPRYPTSSSSPESCMNELHLSSNRESRDDSPRSASVG